ncbi:MAG: transglycosylase domain-containing protein [Desulfurivibrionaceae bacterium]|nr:transglycosylase domain-containing protein [Desulfobulbales bacterium]MDT8334677.1 transglycosylase domain-containing protein [Desulfurivibrionaceae bacterium]
MLKRLSFLLLALGLAAGLAGYCFFHWQVVFAPGKEIRQSSIEKILAVESPVMYRDGAAKIGVFFETSHRQYVPFEKIPRDFINAIVAAEDNKFFEHYGFDAFGVLRAMWANVRAGRVVQGGSTITQQTAKNLFKRKDRSIFSKLKELLFALRLEYHYPKEKILEFYANQFYVSGNGRGLGVAARYYFDKDVDELDLLECAFIAGSVKRPNYYNPFIKNNENDKKLARERARHRAGYVLRQMLNNGLLTGAIHDEMIAREIPFEQGKMYFSLNTIMDLVKEALGEPEVMLALQDHGIDNIATSGIKIVTSIEKNIQEESFSALRKELSRLDVRLRGYERESVQEEYLAAGGRRNHDSSPGSFHFGRIARVETEPQARIWVTLAGSNGEGEGPDAYIDEKGLMNLLVPLVKYEKNRWTEVRKGDLAKLLARLEVEDLVYLSVRAVDDETGHLIADLEKYPLIQGGVLAMQNGKIRAMVGGHENRYFNRAITAKRSMGSVVKPLVYAAALQLGWNSIDVLNNERDVFVYQNKPYFPRPDHQSPHSGVSMSWAGALSENLATIWLLYHLDDRLTPGQFQEVVDFLGLGRLAGESASAYRRRIRDDLGIVIDDQTYHEVAFEKAVAELEPDLIFAGRLDEYEIIRKLHYGRNFDRYYSDVDLDLELADEDGMEIEVDADPGSGEQAALKRVTERKKKEAQLRKNILKRNFLRLKKQGEELGELRADLYEFVAGGPEAGPAAETALYRDRTTGDYIYFDKNESFGARESFEERQELPGEQEGAPDGSGLTAGPESGGNIVPAAWEMVGWEELAGKLGSFYGEQPLPFSAALSNRSENEFWDAVLIDNALTARTIGLIDNALNREHERLRGLDPYGPEFLYQVRDFKIVVALQYLIGLCRAIGIESDLDPVLSFPLGSNVMSLYDVGRAYGTILAGAINHYGGPGSGADLAIIEHIENSDGEIIYVPEPVETRVISPEVRIAVSDILRRVVTHGTGRYADRNVHLRGKDPERNRQLAELGAHVPLVGKTGTANRFTNASFAGGIPGVGENGFFALPEGYILTTYVGFDDNEPMVRGTTHITGAGGSLPLWSRIANRILLENDYASMLDLIDVSFADQIEFPLHYPQVGQREVPVDPGRGGLVSIGDKTGAFVVTFGEPTRGGRLKPSRFFKPFWQVESD